MDLSIVIVNWNGLAVLRNCLPSIFGNADGLGIEVIVVDNASQDESVEFIRRDFPQVVLILNQENRGFAAANNQAFRIARGRHVLLLNNDTIVIPGALAQSVRYLDANPAVGALGCRAEFPDRSFQTSCYRFNDLPELFLTRMIPLGSVWNERLNFGRYWGRQFTSPTEVDVVAGCFMMLRREVIAQTGGFDEDFFMYGEDEEWCSRIKRAGWRIIYFPGATIIHIHRFSSGQTRRARRAGGVMECMSPVLVLHKRRGRLVAWFANLVLLCGSFVRLPFKLALDVTHIVRGTARQGLLPARMAQVTAHFRGIVRPVWIPLPAAHRDDLPRSSGV